MLSDCADLLPRSREEVITPWGSYAEAQAMFDSIIDYGTSTAQLKALGIDPEKAANVAILNHADHPSIFVCWMRSCKTA